MSGKKKPRAVRAAARVNTPLLFLLLAAAPLFGAYYTFIVCLCGTLCALLLARAAGREGALCLPVGPIAWCIYGLCACFLIAIPFALLPGTAAAGFLRALSYLLFFLYIQLLTEYGQLRIKIPQFHIYKAQQHHRIFRYHTISPLLFPIVSYFTVILTFAQTPFCA